MIHRELNISHLVQNQIAMAKINNRSLVSKKGENDIRGVKLLKLKKKYWYMTGGSRRKFLIGFALGQLKSYRKSGFHNKWSPKPGRGWTITSIGQKNECSLADNRKEQSEDSESKDNNEEAEDYFHDHSGSFSIISSSSDDNDANLTFSVELRNQFEDDSGTAATTSALCPLETKEFTLGTFLSLGFPRFLKKIEEHVSTGHCHHAPVKDLVLRGSLDGTTPLLLACHYGDLKTVKYLVEKWGVGVNATAVYYYRSCKFGEATPVFVASYSRRYNIVEYLIGKGADLSLKTTSEENHLRDLTPLLGAIRHYPTRWFSLCDYMGPEHLKTIVIPLVRLLLEKGATLHTLQDGYPIWTGLASYSADLTTLLVNHGMALDQQDERGETVLHSWTDLGKRISYNGNIVEITNEEVSVTVVKSLVIKGANIMIRDTYGNTPIMTAARTRNWRVVDFLLENDGLDRTGKIDAMEMAAAIILMKSLEFDSHVERALGYLRRAFSLREEQPDPILKTPLTLESGRTIEWTTIAEVEAGIRNPTEYKIQSYLTRLRICSSRGSIAVLMLGPLSNCFSNLLEQRRFNDIRDVLWATLDTSRLIVSLSNSERSDVILDVVEHLISMMSQLEKDHHLFIAETFKKPLEFLVEANPFECYTDEHEDYIHYDENYEYDIILQLVTFLARNAKFLVDEDIKESLRHLLAQENRLQGFPATLLRKACLLPHDLSTIRLLLSCRANPNAGNNLGNGPLHILATQYQHWLAFDDKAVGNAAQILLNYGAHLCKVNRGKETAADFWRRVNGDLNHDLPDWLREENFPNLSCQSARVIASQNVHYDDFKLPAFLHPFVEAHRF